MLQYQLHEKTRRKNWGLNICIVRYSLQGECVLNRAKAHLVNKSSFPNNKLAQILLLLAYPTIH